VWGLTGFCLLSSMEKLYDSVMVALTFFPVKIFITVSSSDPLLMILIYSHFSSCCGLENWIDRRFVTQSPIEDDSWSFGLVLMNIALILEVQ